MLLRRGALGIGLLIAALALLAIFPVAGSEAVGLRAKKSRPAETESSRRRRPVRTAAAPQAETDRTPKFAPANPTTSPVFRFVQEPDQPLESEGQTRASRGDIVNQPLDRDGFGPALDGARIGRSLEELAPASDSGASQQTTASDLATSAKPDLASSLAENVDALQAQVRTPISTAPYIRGFKNGQIYAQQDGVYWVSARPDLDSILSKIDPGTIERVDVLSGPYTTVLGPGFTSIDAISLPTPRYENGPESHLQTNASYLNNGRQWYGRETLYGGAENWGYRLSYGHRTGNDYRSGDSTSIPASYNNRDVRADLGYDLNPDQQLAFTYRRVDLTNAEYPGQFFDIGSQVVNAFSARLTDKDPFAPWTRLDVDGWYNRTWYTGDNTNLSKRTFNVVPRIEGALTRNTQSLLAGRGIPSTDVSTDFLGLTDGDLMSTGARLATMFGDVEDANLTMGADVRRLNQQIHETFAITTVNNSVSPATVTGDVFSTNVPRSGLTDPGLFAELRLPTASYWRSGLGARVDLVHTDAMRSDLLTGKNLEQRDRYNSLAQNDALYAFFLTNRIELDPNWTANLDFGHAQRAPTLIDRYADGVFLGIIQNGFSRVIGDPRVKKERNWQIDLGLSGDYENWRGSIRGFHAWILDYITYGVNDIGDPDNARLLITQNTPLATLSGCELSNDFDLNPFLTPFATFAYVYGHDQAIGKPLPSIPPMYGRLGLRLHDRDHGRTWGIEAFARVVAQQNREGVLRLGPTNFASVEERTAGFTTVHLRAYWSVNENLHLVSGIDNLFDRNYLEHLSLRLTADSFNGQNAVLSPGFSPYFSMQWTY